MSAYRAGRPARLGIRLDAGTEVGTGHLQRCLPLAEEWRRQGGEVVFFCRPNTFLSEKLQQTGFSFTGVPSLPPGKELPFMRQASAGCRLLLVDGYRFSSGYIHGLNRPGLLLCAMDDDALYTYSCDALINPHPFAQRLAIKTGPKKPIKLFGGQYWVLRQEYADAAPIAIRPKVAHALILMGGADVNNYMPTALVAVCGALKGEGRVTAVLGPMSRNDDEVHALAKKLAGVAVVKNPPHMAALMASCDLAVSAGGNTVYELCALGIPSVIVPQTENERVKAAFLAGDGVVDSPGDYARTGAPDLEETVAALMADRPRRRQMHETAQGVVTRHGAENLAQALMQLC